MSSVKLFQGRPVRFHEFVRSAKKYDFDVATCFCGHKITTNPAIMPKALCSACNKDFRLGEYEGKYRAIYLSAWANVIL